MSPLQARISKLCFAASDYDGNQVNTPGLPELGVGAAQSLPKLTPLLGLLSLYSGLSSHPAG